MEVIRVAFNFAMGLIACLMVLMASAMIAYILKVTIIEIIGSDPFRKIKEWLDETVSDSGTKKR